MIACLSILIFGLVLSTQANYMCRSCVPLNNLLMEAYGIDMNLDGLSSAVAFHNGTMKHLSYSTGSAQYKTLLYSVVDAQLGHQPQDRKYNCPMSDQNLLILKPSYWQSLTVYIEHVFSFLKSPPEQEDSGQCTDDEEELTGDEITIRLLQTELESLQPFVNMSKEQRAQAHVTISVPGWMIGRNETCLMARAAMKVFGHIFRIENRPSASYTSMGYELCRTNYEYFHCLGPGRIMTIDFEADRFVSISQMRTPIMYRGARAVTSAVTQNHNVLDTIDWINSFIDTQKPDMIMLTGPNVNEPRSIQVIQQSKANALLINQTGTDAEHVVVMGAAQIAKDDLEAQSDDCTEPEECYEIRREANRIAGGFSLPVPSVWPSAWIRRFDDEL